MRLEETEKDVSATRRLGHASPGGPPVTAGTRGVFVSITEQQTGPLEMKGPEWSESKGSPAGGSSAHRLGPVWDRGRGGSDQWSLNSWKGRKHMQSHRWLMLGLLEKIKSICKIRTEALWYILTTRIVNNRFMSFLQCEIQRICVAKRDFYSWCGTNGVTTVLKMQSPVVASETAKINKDVNEGSQSSKSS